MLRFESLVAVARRVLAVYVGFAALPVIQAEPSQSLGMGENMVAKCGTPQPQDVLHFAFLSVFLGKRMRRPKKIPKLVNRLLLGKHTDNRLVNFGGVGVGVRIRGLQRKRR